MNRDTWTGILAAAALVAAMVGVFFYEQARFEDEQGQEYTIDWQMVEAEATSVDGTALNAAGSRDHMFPVTANGVAHVRSELAWSDAVGANDEFKIELKGAPPGFTVDPKEGTTSPLSLEIPVNAEPTTTRVRGQTEEEARANAGADLAAGQGNWTITVRLVSAPGGQLPTQTDGSNAYTLTFSYDVWDPQLTAA